MTQLNSTNKSPAELLEELTALQQISWYVDSKMTLPDILQRIAETTAKTMKADTCSILLKEEGRDELVIRAVYGLNPQLVDRGRLVFGQGLPGHVARSRAVLMVRDAPKDPRFFHFPDSNVGDFKTFLGAPLLIREELVGVMTVRFRENNEIEPSDVTLFRTICTQIGIVIEKSRLYFAKIESERMAAIGLSLSEISHSIKNILSNMQGGLYLVDRCLRNSDLEGARSAWDVVRKNNRRIAGMVENMLTFSRTSTPEFEQDNLNMLVHDVLQSVEKNAAERGVEIAATLQPDLPDIFFDYDSLYNAVLNLASNAIECFGEGQSGRVEVSTWKDQAVNQVVFSITDNGPGITPDDQKKIFKLFFSTKGNRGTGIGLAVTKKIIEQHGGSIRMESEFGGGTRFTVRLPITPSRATRQHA